MRKLIKKLLAPLVREVVQQEIKDIHSNLKTLLVREALRQVSLELKNNFDMKRKTVLLLNGHWDVIGREIITTFLGIVVKKEKILYNRAVKYRR